MGQFNHFTFVIFALLVPLKAMTPLVLSISDSATVIVTITQVKGPPLEDVRLIRSGEIWVVEMSDGTKRQIAEKRIKGVFMGDTEVTKDFPELTENARSKGFRRMVAIRQPNLVKMFLFGSIGATIGGFTPMILGVLPLGDGPVAARRLAVWVIFAGFIGGEALGVAMSLPPGAESDEKMTSFLLSTGINTINFMAAGLTGSGFFNPVTGAVLGVLAPYYYYKEKVRE